MKGLERALEFLRPFVDTRSWDYCVVWKLGDDCSRFIEWMGCCCSGASNGSCEEKNQNQSVPLCRDCNFAHKMNSKTCEALAAFPSFLPLCSSEIYGDVVSSNQSKWIFNSTPIDGSSWNESLGTRVLIPVLGGLIELFADKHIAKDQKIIDFIRAHCNVPKQESTVDHFYSSLDPFVEQNLHNLPTQSYLLSLLCGPDTVHSLNRCSTLSSLQGSSASLDPSDDHQSLVSHCDYFSHGGISNLSLQNPKKSKSDKNFLKNQGYQVLSKGIHKPEFRSKNLITERNRRNRINDGIFTLRSLVPKITKMNKVATLGDAIDYIRELEKEFKDLQDELTELEKEQEQECKDSNTELKTSDEKNSPSEINQGSTGVYQKKRIETEVNQLGKKEFLIKVFSEKEKGGFRRLIDLVYSMGLQVSNVNMTTCNGHVSTFLTVEAISKDVQLKRLKESLLKLGG